MSDISKRTAELIGPILNEEGCELIDIELQVESGQKVLRIFIDKEGGVQLQDCARVSHAVEDLLEVEQIIPGRYHLEVSSPGLNRPLKTLKHFQAAVGKTIQVATAEKINERRRFKGTLREIKGAQMSADAAELVIFIDNQDYFVPLRMVQKANLVFEL